MKIIHICIGAFYPDGYSYQENMLPKFHKEMGHEVYVIAGLDVFNENGKTTYLSKGKEYIGDYGVKVIRLNFRGIKIIARKLKNYNGLYQEIDSIKPDIIFVHNCQFICIADLIRYLKKHTEVKCYVDNHADFSNSATNWFSKFILHGFLWRKQAQKILPFVEKFYGVLPARVDFLKNVYQIPSNKCELLVMGADDDLVEKADNDCIKRAVRKRYGIKPDDFLIITGGKIDGFKKQTLLLMDAVNDIKNDQIKLIVFGSVTQALKNDVEIRCSKRVQYIGWQKSAYSYELFAASDLVCFPGRHSVFWEQVVAQGIPMVCKSWEGTHHIDVGGNVVFLYDDSKDEIVAVLSKILSDRKRYDSMKTVAESKGKKIFSYRNIAKRCIGLSDTANTDGATNNEKT